MDHKKTFYITYADGSYALYRVDCVLKSMGERLFYDEFFGYGDDSVLGLMLWNNHYKVIAVPEVIAVHKRGATFGRRDVRIHMVYLIERNRVALSYVTNTRYKHVIRFYALRVALPKLFRSITVHHMKSLYDGTKLGRVLKRKYNLVIDIYKAPMLEISLKELIMHYFVGTKKGLSNLYEKKVKKLIKKLEVD